MLAAVITAPAAAWHHPMFLLKCAAFYQQNLSLPLVKRQGWFAWFAECTIQFTSFDVATPCMPVVTTNVFNVKILSSLSLLALRDDSADGACVNCQVLDMLEHDEAVGQSLPVVCHNHPDCVNQIRHARDFDTFVRDGGCSLRCTARLPCGHACSRCVTVHCESTVGPSTDRLTISASSKACALMQ